MSATAFHPEPSAKAPWTKTIVLTAPWAGDDTAIATLIRRLKSETFMFISSRLSNSSLCVCRPVQLGDIDQIRVTHDPGPIVEIGIVASLRSKFLLWVRPGRY